VIAKGWIAVRSAPVGAWRLPVGQWRHRVDAWRAPRRRRRRPRRLNANGASTVAA